MHIEATAPNRIDFAGGTTDLFPLYLLMDGGCTVNLAINVMSRASIQTTPGKGIKIVSKDLERSLQVASSEELKDAGSLKLLARTIKALGQVEDIELVTLNEAPAGSGLGASSALLVAMLAALHALRGARPLDPSQLIQLAVHIETSVLGIPAGSQDHIAAFFGGLSVVRFDIHGFTRQEVALNESDKKTLEDMVILSYTGASRFSGMNNWDIIKSFIDRKDKTSEHLIQIRDLSEDLAAELVQKNFHKLPTYVKREWSLRKQLSPGVTNPTVESLMAAAEEKGALANKLCGAGGGGCMISLVERPDRPKVEKAIQEAGARLIPFAIDTKGVWVEARGDA